tara:strand:+ start:819 stop:1232 length:414 start_codon:yes stop_codon:yes gene_type:complete
MSYINNNVREVSPFDIGKISGTTNATFNTFNVDWLSLSGNNILSSDNSSYYSEASFSPNSNVYGLARVHYDGNTSNLHLMGCNMPESSHYNAGAYVRSDDIAIHNGNSHYPKYQNSLSITLTQDVSRANMKIIRVEI